MARTASITSTRSFQSRLLQAERWRIALMIGCLAVVLIDWIERRDVHGAIAAVDAAFYPTLAILLVGMSLLGVALLDTTRRMRAGGAMAWWRLIAGVVLDLGVPLGMLLVLHLRSPEGSFAALSEPAILILPIVIMLSVLRLRVVFSLLTGLAAAVGHWALGAHAVSLGKIAPHELPVVHTYGVFLALTGVAAGVLAIVVRRYIKEAVSEAEAAERAARELEAVEHDLEIARDIQLGLLPDRPPTLAGFDVAGMARPATQAGGDYYDWQPLPDGRLVVAIADVTGHGIGPALVMAVCRAYARATAPTTGSTGEFLNRLNDLIVEDVKGRRFITMAVAVLSPDGSVDLLSAGHGPTFLYRKGTAGVEWFGGDGLPLGVVDGESYGPTTHLRIEPGDALVLLTDGFMERTRAGGEQFGMERLTRAITDNAARPAADLIDAIDREVEAFAQGSAQGDDMTAVVVRRV